MRPDEDRARAQGREVLKELLAVLHVCVVRLIVAEEPPGGAKLARRAAGVDRDRDGGLGRCAGPGGHRGGKHDHDRRGGPESHDRCSPFSRNPGARAGGR